MPDKYEITVYRSKADQIFIAEVPQLSGCPVAGSSDEAAIARAELAIEDWLETAVAIGRIIPKPVAGPCKPYQRYRSRSRPHNQNEFVAFFIAVTIVAIRVSEASLLGNETVELAKRLYRIIQ